ncbi:MAG: glutamate--tRNA ligase family protein [bacterium]
MSVRVRFAPSPTGQVHIGNIRAAIFNWLFARHAGGSFLLRIEDTDRERSTPEAVKAVLDAMSWLGLECDEPPVYQSTQLPKHQAAVEQLLQSGRAYRGRKGDDPTSSEVIFFRMPGTDMLFHDEIKGTLVKKAEDLKDFVIVRSDGSPVFHLANVVDDISMRITHVIRGDDHIENTYRHVAIFQALGASVPNYAHLPMIVNAQGKPYSKRDGAAFVGDFREQGFLDVALFNYLSLLGWAPGDDLEKMRRGEAAARFTHDHVKSSPAQVDLRKLTHLNSLYLSEMPPAAFIQTVRDYAATRVPWVAETDPALFDSVAGLLQSRTTLLANVDSWRYFFDDQTPQDAEAVKKNLHKPGVCDSLILVRDGLAELPELTVTGVESVLRAAEAACGLAVNKLNQPVRVAVTGVTVGASIYDTIVLLGAVRTRTRLDRAIAEIAEKVV